MRFLLVFFLFVPLMSCQQNNTDQQAQPHLQTEDTQGIMIARVGNKAFYESDIDMAFAPLPENIQNLRDDLNARAQILQTLIRRYVLSQKAIEMKLEQDPVLRYQIQQARNDILINALQTWKQEHLEEPTEAKIHTFFLKNKKQFQVPEQIHVRHIIVATHDEALDVLKRIKAGADFAELAVDLSLDDNSKVHGGDLNWFGRGMMDKDFEDSVFALKNEGDISPAFQTQFGWHIAELIAKKETIQRTVDNAKDEIKQQLQHQQLQQWLNTLVEDKKIQIIRTEYSIDPQHNSHDSKSSS